MGTGARIFPALNLRGAGFQGQGSVRGIQLEEIAVRSGRWAGQMKSIAENLVKAA